MSHDPINGGEYYCNENCFEIIFLKTIVMWAFYGFGILVFGLLVIYGSTKSKSEDITIVKKTDGL